MLEAALVRAKESMLRNGLIVLLLVGASGLSACGLFRKREKTQSDDPVMLQVVNNNWSDIVIYALVDGSRTRLGDVGSTRTRMLRLPNSVLASSGMLQLVLDPLGSRNTYRTGVIMVSGGQRVRLQIENELRLTSWTVQ